ncbi:MAG: trypsin-like peptidase domain-containing protein, partial [Flavisolibacter sp.]|nr:trypsin-like peptidase domain-containing protein [Flavisolibacter sp.]
MSQLSQQHFKRIVHEYGDVIPGLQEQLEANIKKEFEVENELPPFVRAFRATGVDEINIIAEESGRVAVERVIVATAGARPVVKILNDQVTTQFLGKNTENSPWKDVILAVGERLNQVIPSVGRIELNNGEAQWVGTGWMIDEGIIVTNAHVAEIFAEPHTPTSSFVFKPGLLGESVSARIDFLEEESRPYSIEHPITSVLWIASAEETDVAFLKVERGATSPPLPKPVDLADAIEEGAAVAAIGYPARDPSIRDQDLVISIFGDEVYEKKRLSPGRIKSVGAERFEHDCSTLGGSSGSLVIDLKTGKAVGLHQGGYLNDSANLGITISHLKTLLGRVKNRIVDLSGSNVAATSVTKTDTTMQEKNDVTEIKVHFQIPFEVTIKMGQIVSATPAGLPGAGSPVGASALTAAPLSMDAALELLKQTLAANPDIINIRKGYRFKNGWITDEKVIVVEVKEKLDFKDLMGTGKKPLPREIMGVGIDVRTAPLPDQLDHLKIDLTVLERKGKPAGYKEPPGYDDPNSNMYLKRVREKMDAIFHVSPDEGFKNLSAFIGRTQAQLTATIY